MPLFFVYKHLFISNAVGQQFGAKITQLALARKLPIFLFLLHSFWHFFSANDPTNVNL